MNIKRAVLSLLTCLLIVLTWPAPAAFAETPLPDGAVKGLPERLAALDDQGKAVNSATGEYFFHVEGMSPGETYTKNVQLINLRDDQSYHIYFCVEPLFKNGEIDLEEGCTCRFFLDGKEFFTGNVNGVGNIDLTEYYDCGYFAPGVSHTLRCEITFDKMAIDRAIDNGWRLVDSDGVHVLRDPSGDNYVYGEIEFKWIFAARVGQEGEDPDDSQNDDPNHIVPSSTDPGNDNPLLPPRTGLMLRDGRVWLTCMGIVAVMIVVMLILIKKQKGKNGSQKKRSSSEKKE